MYPFESSLSAAINNSVAVVLCCSLKDRITFRDKGVPREVRKLQTLIRLPRGSGDPGKERAQ